MHEQPSGSSALSTVRESVTRQSIHCDRPAWSGAFSCNSMRAIVYLILIGASAREVLSRSGSVYHLPRLQTWGSIAREMTTTPRSRSQFSSSPNTPSLPTRPCSCSSSQSRGISSNTRIEWCSILDATCSLVYQSF